MRQSFVMRAAENLDRFGMAMALVPSYTRVNPPLQEEIKEAFAGTKSVRQALDDAARAWLPSLQEAKWDD
ncbi:MAG: hypothetical protein ACRDJN_18565 [Chloroflexota bacterium]